MRLWYLDTLMYWPLYSETMILWVKMILYIFALVLHVCLYVINTCICLLNPVSSSSSRFCLKHAFVALCLIVWKLYLRIVLLLLFFLASFLHSFETCSIPKGPIFFFAGYGRQYSRVERTRGPTNKGTADRGYRTRGPQDQRTKRRHTWTWSLIFSRKCKFVFQEFMFFPRKPFFFPVSSCLALKLWASKALQVYRCYGKKVPSLNREVFVTNVPPAPPNRIWRMLETFTLKAVASSLHSHLRWYKYDLGRQWIPKFFGMGGSQTKKPGRRS